MDNLELVEELANLRLAARRFEQLFQCLPIACLGCDLDGTIFEWNRACERILATPAAELFMATIYRTLCRDAGQRLRLGEMLAEVGNGKSFESFEWEIGAAHSPRHVLCSMLPKPGNHGEVVGCILACLDMTKQKQYEMQIEAQLEQIHQYSSEIESRQNELEVANRMLESLASTDGLTGLANHRTFYERLERELRTPVKPGSISLILLDVDNFKHFNDTFGHPEGDTVLRQVAKVLLDASRSTDLPARYGGEEFAVLVNADRDRAMGIAERMRKGIEDQPWPLRMVTASFGVATASGHATAESLVASADAALYRSKREGKNCVTHADARDTAVAA